MQVTITISDAIIRQAAQKGKSVAEYVEYLIDAGAQAQGRPVVSSAIERIRELRIPKPGEIR